MNKHPKKDKTTVVSRYLNGKTISKISHDLKISRTTIYAWIKEYNNTFHNGKAPNFRYLHDLQQKCERQQKIIEILQRSPCATSAPLSKRYEVIKDLSAEYKIYEKDRITESRFVKAKNFIPATVAKQESKELLSVFSSKVFDYPKPLSLMTYLIGIVPQSDITSLDFFAGSGTTGHAVMKLNAEDGGNRKFILCTNNENNICRDVTYERIKRVIAKEDYKASLKYFKVDYLPISNKLYYEYADELLLHIRELVELENGINFNGNAEIAIVLTETELDNFTQNIPETCTAIYVGHDVLPTEEQEKIFAKRKIKVNVIPEYYYRDLEG